MSACADQIPDLVDAGFASGTWWSLEAEQEADQALIRRAETHRDRMGRTWLPTLVSTL